MADLVTPPATLAILAIALLIEAALGYPDALYRALGHPVTWIGRLIGRLDDGLNPPTAPSGRGAGIVALALVLLATAAAAMLGVAVASALPIAAAALLLAALTASLPAQRSLHDHVAAVADALAEGGLEDGRAAVSRIVGRDPASLDAAGVSRAAIESLAENFSDGVVAPAVWLGIGGLPGGALYKAINTADSMIGHRSPRHHQFGWAAARLDDLVNLPCSRLAALLLVLAAATAPWANARGAWRAVRRDARRHRSPNAGWPEAAMAGALGLRLAGPRVYADGPVADAWMGEGRAEATAADIRRALALYRRACAMLWVGVATLAGAAALGTSAVR